MLPRASSFRKKRIDFIKKITDGAYALARANKVLSNFSLSPIHLDTKLDAEILKNLQLHSVATAFANKVFPLPGGP